MRIDIPASEPNTSISLEVNTDNPWENRPVDAELTVRNINTGEVSTVLLDLISLHSLAESVKLVRSHLNTKVKNNVN